MFSSKWTWIIILLLGAAVFVGLGVAMPSQPTEAPGDPSQDPPPVVARVILLLLMYFVFVCLLISVVALVYAFLPVSKVPLVYNLRNLQIRWKTTVITALAFTLVVALLTVMLAFVSAMYKMTGESGVPGNVMVLSDGAPDEVVSNLPGNVSVELLPSDLQAGVMKDEKGRYMAVKELYIIVNQLSGQTGKPRFVQMRGIDDGEMAAKVHNIKLQPGGSWFSPSGVRTIGKDETAYEIVLGSGMARTFGNDLGKEKAAVGEVLEIGPRKWVVIGIMDEAGSTFANEIWARDQHVAENYGRTNSYSSFVVRTKDEATAKHATKLIKEFRGEKSLAAYTEKEYYEKMSQTNAQFLFTFGFITFIIAVGGIFGVMNTMFAAVSQRAKDIGVLRLLGYSRGMVLMSFLLESLVIGLCGGVLGCAVGYALANGYTASSIISSGPGGGKTVVLQLIVTPMIMAIGLLFAFFMGSIGGLFPSLSAMRLKPLEQLR